MAASLEFSFSYKGKEYQFVEETKKNLETLQCPVCLEIVLVPVQQPSSQVSEGEVPIHSQRVQVGG